MTAIAVTGASGYLGRLVMEALAREDGLRVVAVDPAEPDAVSGNAEWYRFDLTAPELSDAIAGCDALVHTDDDHAEAVAAAARLAGVRKVVVVSGRATVDSDAAEVVTVLQPAWVGGPRRPAGPIPERQTHALHEDDLVSAVRRGLDEDIPGTFHLSGDEETNAVARAAGFVFSRTSADALDESRTSAEPSVSLGPVRIETRWLALAGVLAVALGVLRSTVRAWRGNAPPTPRTRL